MTARHRIAEWFGLEVQAVCFFDRGQPSKTELGEYMREDATLEEAAQALARPLKIAVSGSVHGFEDAGGTQA